MADNQTAAAPTWTDEGFPALLRGKVAVVTGAARGLQPEQVAPLAVFLASDAAAMVTGACYDVTGGDSAHVSA